MNIAQDLGSGDLDLNLLSATSLCCAILHKSLNLSESLDPLL